MCETKTAAGGRIRFPEYDIAKGIGVILVGIGHSPGLPFSVLLWIHSFHVPLYFFISGIFVKDEDDTPFLTSLKKNIKGLLLPYLVFSFVFLLMDILFPDIYTNPKLELKYILMGQGSYGALWFFFVLFFERLILDVLRRFVKSKKLLTVLYVLMTAAGLFLHYQGLNEFKLASILYSSGFYYLGFLLKKSRFLLDVTKKERWYLLPAFFGANLLGILALYRLTGTTLDLNSATAFDIVLNYGTALSGIAVMLILSRLLTGNAVGTVFSYVGKNSLYFYPLLGGYIPFKIESYTLSKTIPTQLLGWIIAAGASVALSEIARLFKKKRKQKAAAS